MARNDDSFSKEEAERRLIAALRGARLVEAPHNESVTLKKEKGKPAKVLPSSGASRANAKIERP